MKRQQFIASMICAPVALTAIGKEKPTPNHQGMSLYTTERGIYQDVWIKREDCGGVCLIKDVVQYEGNLTKNEYGGILEYLKEGADERTF